VPRSLSFKIPNKKKNLALRTLFTAKLSEGKLRVVDSEKIEEGKTKIVAKMIEIYGEQLILFIGDYQMDANFLRA
jgi:ribosomal protein L4